MAGLVSRWADDPELVTKAEQQDTHKSSTPTPSKPKSSINESKYSSPVTSEKGKPLESKWASPVVSEKGKPLASRWADAPDEEERVSPIKNKQNRHQKKSPRKPQQRFRPEPEEEEESVTSRFDKALQLDTDEEDEKTEMSPEAKKFASRLGSSGSTNSDAKPKINFNSSAKHVVEGDEWEDEDEEAEDGDEVEDEEEEGEEELQPTAPTKAAQDFASRLGISINAKSEIRHNREQERGKHRNERLNARRDWDQGKPISPQKSSHQHSRPQSKPQSRWNQNDRPTESKPNAQKESVPKEPEIDEETKRKQIEADQKLEKLLQSGDFRNMNWADFDDDDL